MATSKAVLKTAASSRQPFEVVRTPVPSFYVHYCRPCMLPPSFYVYSCRPSMLLSFCGLLPSFYVLVATSKAVLKTAASSR